MAHGNTYVNSGDVGGNDAPADEEYGGGTASVKCLHIYAMPDGSFAVEESTGMAPEKAQTVPDLASVVTRVEETFGNQAEDPEALAAAQRGYGKPREMNAPNPMGLFGE